MIYSVVVTTSFKKHAKGIAKKHRSLKDDIEQLITSLEETPTQGEPLGKDCYKIRLAIASKGKGKRGGARVITHFHILNDTVYLLSIYDKAEQDSISDSDIKNLLKDIE